MQNRPSTRACRATATIALFLREHRPLDRVTTREVDAAEREMLESLGYVASSGSGDPFAPDLPEPRERVGDANTIAMAMALFVRGQALLESKGSSAMAQREGQKKGREMLESAKQKLESVRDADPANPELPVHLSAVEGALGNYDAAVALLHQALEHHPKHSLLRHNLATAYYKMGRRDEALAEIRIAIEIEPSYPRYYRWLATFYIREGKFDEAAVWLDKRSELTEEGTPAHGQVRRWIAEAHAEMRRRGHDTGG